jgi:adenine-specific DNA methylase
VSNELNPVAWLINEVILEYAPSEGSLDDELQVWIDKISSEVEDELEEYFPKRNGVAPNHYFRAYSIKCPSCGKRLPISNRWWFNRRRGVATRPYLEEGNLRFEIVRIPEDVEKSEFDPSKGTAGDGEIECPHCDVVTERDSIVELFKQGDFEFEVCGVQYEEEVEGHKYHSPTEQDRKAIKAAQDRIENDLELATLLTNDRYIGLYDRAEPYGIDQWRDLFSPRQLISHAAFLKAFKKYEPEIKSEYTEQRSNAVLTLLSFISVKLIERNSRLQPLDIEYGSPANMLGNNGFFYTWHYGESNLMAGSYSYRTAASNVIENYEEVAQYVSHVDGDSADVLRGDASNLPYETNSIESIVVDPPYGDNLVYAETADAFYVWFREYLMETFPDAFSSPETNKEDEAVENPAIVNPSDTSSTSELARARYEDKMSDIFSESYRVLEKGGVLTIYFTDKQVDAWDSLTMSLIRSGFIITSTHTITSEMPQRIGARERASADTTLLLVCRKPHKEHSERRPTLWSDIREKSKSVAREKATELLDSQYNLTKTDTIISAFGPTLRVFTENFPVVDDKDEEVRPRQALQEARTAVTEVLIEKELEGNLQGVDSLTKWYILSWLVYESEAVPYDEARQLGLGVGVQIDEIKRSTKIWRKSGDTVVLASHDDRVQDHTELESGAKRRSRKYPVDPRDQTFDNHIDGVYAAFSVLDTKGGEFAWNWLNERNLQEKTWFRQTLQSLLQVLPEDHNDYQIGLNLISGQTGDLLDIDIGTFSNRASDEDEKTTLNDF